MRRAIAIVIFLAACGDNRPPSVQDPPPDAGPVDVPDAGPATLAPCLDRPTDLARPPVDRLPCDLLPPGFGT
jgi:hypothetical protein